MLNLIEYFRAGIKKYGLKLIITIVIFELIYIYKLRFSDYFATKKGKNNLEPYVPTPYYILFLIKKKIKNIIKDSIFIEFGCGKGRVISYFENEEFSKIIGIEINSNLQKYLYFKSKKIKIFIDDCRNINFLNEIQKLTLNKTLVLYFYHPFSITDINFIIKYFLSNNNKIILVIVGKLEINKKFYSKLVKNFSNNMLQIYLSK